MKGADPMPQAFALLQAGRADQAIAQLKRLLQKQPNDAATVHAMGAVYLHLGEFAQAEFFLARAVKLWPGVPAYHNNLANALYSLNRLEEAVGHYRTALERDPSYFPAYIGLAPTLTRLDRWEEAAAASFKAIELRPDLAIPYDNAALALTRLGEIEEAENVARAGLARLPRDARLRGTLIGILAYSDRVTPQELAAECGVAGAAVVGEAPALLAHTNGPDSERRVRVGYLSPDFRTHSVAYFLEGLLANHDHDRFEIACYDTATGSDAVTARLRSYADRWVECPRLDSDSLASRIRADQIDILVELSGYSSGHRMSVMARKPAPVQVSYLGWATSTGVPTIDYRMVDSVTDPAGFERLSSERLVRLDPCFLAYRPPDGAPEVAERPGGGDVVFGSFNTVQKITPSTIGMWAGVLKAVQGSRLLLKSQGLVSARARDRIMGMLTGSGVEPDRVEMLGQTAGIREHLEMYSRVDVGLDTVPYNGTTTTCEALWMGVPVAAIEGDRHSARVSASILRAIGLPELVAPSVEGWTRLAAELAGNRAGRAELRATLRGRMASSALCDASGHARRVEAAYRRMWAEWCSVRADKRG